jgi:hypothetical protein
VRIEKINTLHEKVLCLKASKLPIAKPAKAKGSVLGLAASIQSLILAIKSKKPI